MADEPAGLAEWLQTIQRAQPVADKLLAQAPENQKDNGYFHTLREICQQPLTWPMTAELVVANAERLQALVHRAANIILTGSGSSEYVGECVRLALQNGLRIPVSVIGGGTLVAHGI